jgi:hypothetical protein
VGNPTMAIFFLEEDSENPDPEIEAVYILY